ncbi:hypothetical protein [Nocardioides abyssi]|uniref:DNA-binding protein n=1 Tax=Nocardioides abyssi TaxID=3058370 RepID=A0ABT8EQK5_9ACTN|nr:hypothetical protein [Nocardioides abyssi]MDN4160424.1 hypothetical protein [Nocardioides abyssi]
MTYNLNTTDLANALAELGFSYSAPTLRRHASTGRIPAKIVKGGRYLFDLEEVVRTLTTPGAHRTLSQPPLSGGLGKHTESHQQSEADRLRTATRQHQNETP